MYKNAGFRKSIFEKILSQAERTSIISARTRYTDSRIIESFRVGFRDSDSRQLIL